MSRPFLSILLVVIAMATVSVDSLNEDAIQKKIKVLDTKHAVDPFTINAFDRAAKEAQNKKNFEGNETYTGTNAPFVSKGKISSVIFKLLLVGTVVYFAICCSINCLCPLWCNTIKVEHYSDAEMALRTQGAMERGKFLEGGSSSDAKRSKRSKSKSRSKRRSVKSSKTAASSGVASTKKARKSSIKK